MTPEQLAEEAITIVYNEPTQPSGRGMHRLIASLFEQYASQQVAAERERCAKLAEMAAAALANGVTDKSVGAVFSLPTLIRQGQPAAPQWTRDAPTVPGYYWFRDAERGHSVDGKAVPDVVLVQQVSREHGQGDGPVWLFNSALESLYYWDAVSDYPNGEWCGPLEVPT